MATVTDICNLALSRLGDEANVQSIAPPDGSPQASLCAAFYPQARDTLLTMRPWSFALVRSALAPLVQDNVHSAWAYSYAYPANCLAMQKVLPPDATDDVAAGGAQYAAPFRVESREDGAVVVLTNTEQAVGVYMRRVEDTSKFPPLFSDSLAWLLASYLAGPLVKGAAGRAAAADANQAFQAALAAASRTDANQQKLADTLVASWIAARG